MGAELHSASPGSKKAEELRGLTVVLPPFSFPGFWEAIEPTPSVCCELPRPEN